MEVPMFDADFFRALIEPVRPFDRPEYDAFLKAKVALAGNMGFEMDPGALHPWLKPHAASLVAWAVRKGRAGIFASFGMAKTSCQLEIGAVITGQAWQADSGTREAPTCRFLIVAPLGVRQEFRRDAASLGLEITFIKRTSEVAGPGIYVTNYESARDAKIDMTLFEGVSLDEAARLRGFGGTKTFRSLMGAFEGTKYRFVATATPSPNEYIELLAYAAFLGVMDVGEAKTRFFKRDSANADKLTLHPHKEREFWIWVASWAIFLLLPSDLGFDDTGYVMPALDVHWHEVPTDHAKAGQDREGQGRMFRNAALGVSESASEKRQSMDSRIAKMMELREIDPGAHRIIWHDLEDERRQIEAAVPSIETVYGTQKLEDREAAIIAFADGATPEIAAKPMMLGAGVNLQRHCSWAIYLGIGHKFHDFIQSVHRLQRFGQANTVRIDMIYTEAEREIRRSLEAKWKRHVELVEKMRAIVREFGLAEGAFAAALTRSMGLERREASGDNWTVVNNDSVLECAAAPENSVDLILTSIPFATQYEYSPSFNDFGHTDDNAHFWQQMDFLTPGLLRMLSPGRVFACHVKDRIVPGGVNGLGFQTLHPFHAEAIYHYQRHGFAFMGMKTITTDVVRENNQTYRLGWTEQCKDGTKMGCGVPEYLLLFRKPPTDRANGYADDPVVKDKPLCTDNSGSVRPFDKRDNWKKPKPGTGYSRSAWQLDAHGFARSSGDRLLSGVELANMPHADMYKWWEARNTTGVYDYAEHKALCEALDEMQRLPATFMLFPPHSVHPDVWSDVARMRTLNMEQERSGQEMHLCLAVGSLVLTREYGYIPIQEVRGGMNVWTHKGRWRQVLVSRSTGAKDCVTITAQGVPGLTLTPDHKLWTRKVRDNAWSVAHSKKDAQQSDPDWWRADETLGSYINMKVPDAEEMPAQVDWWTVGRWLADGHWSGGDTAVLSLGKHKADDAIAMLGKHAGNELHDHGGCYQLSLKDPDGILRLVLRQCGKGAENKHVPAVAFTLPQKEAKFLLEGYLSGDGHYLKQRRRWTCSSVSKVLVMGLAVLAQRAFGAVASVYPGRGPRTAEIEGRTVNCLQEWIMCFDIPDEDRHKGLPFILDDGAWKKVRSIKLAGEVETWNLRVQEDESFTAEGCIVKNCPLQYDICDRVITQFSMPGETVFDPFAGIGSVPLRAMRLGRFGYGSELSADYWRDAVRYCEAEERKMATPSLFDILSMSYQADDVPEMSGAMASADEAEAAE